MSRKCKKFSILMWIFLNFIKFIYTSGEAIMFSELPNDNFTSILTQSLLSSYLPNVTRIQPFNIVNNLKQSYTYSIEFNSDFYSCEQTLGLFSKNNTQNSILISHDLIDCDENSLSEASLSNLKNFTVFSLSPTSIQIYEAIKSIINGCNCAKFGIIYANDVFHKEMSESVVSKLFQDAIFFNVTNNLNFSVSVDSSNLQNLLIISDIKILILLLNCGDDIEFVSNYNAQLNSKNIIVISIDSPLCVVLGNLTISSNFTNLYKLVPFDRSSSFTNSYTQFFKNNLSAINDINILDALNELEDYFVIKYINLTTNTVFIDFLNYSIYFYCETQNVTYCTRNFTFSLYGYNNMSKLNYSHKLIQIEFPYSNSTSAKINYDIQFRDKCSSKTNSIFCDEPYCIAMFLLIVFIILAFLVVVVGYFVRNRIAKKELSMGPNKLLLLADDLDFVNTHSSQFMSRPKLEDIDEERKPNGRLNSNASGIDTSIDLKTSKHAKYKGDIAVVKYLKIPNFQMKSTTMRDLKMLRDLRHENLNAFLGCYVDLKTPSLVFEHASKGSLQDIIMKSEIKLDWNFKWSMLNDLARGMRYIHHSPIKFHGNLKSRNCVVDSRWVLKLTDFGLPQIFSNQKCHRTLIASDLLWTAPEHLKQTKAKDKSLHSFGSQAGDIYSFGIIMQEIIIRGAPFCMMGLTDEEIIKKIKKPPPLLRPSVSKTAAPPEYVNIMRDCWSEIPEHRPPFDRICVMFKSLNGEKKVNIVDLMFKMIEQYTNNLEDLIKEKTIKLEEEKKKTEKLLSEMLPKPVAESLMSGNPVHPENYDCVTIYFSDIVGFTTISAYSSPFEVVDLLNDLYSMFDSILTDFDVYKVETIGDAYMVVSGLPIRNGDNHAGEISTVALNLLHSCAKFKIRHLPGIPLRLRIGIHSGPCVTGVVGLKMPRFCLFGDTVNTASRMESTSQAYRIHVSESTANILEKLGGYKLDFRGVTELKGKGQHKTFWLTGKDGFDKELPDPVVSDNNHGIDSQLIETIKRIRAEKQAELEKKASEGKPLEESSSIGSNQRVSNTQRDFLITPTRNPLEKKHSFREVTDDVVKEIKEIRSHTYSSSKTINDSGFSESNGQLNEPTHQFEKRYANKKKRNNLTEIENS